DRLYAALPPGARRLASRIALSELPLPAEATESTADLGPDEARQGLKVAVAYGLVQEFVEPPLPDLYATPRLLRAWLAAPERAPQADAGEVHRRLAAFWRASYERGRDAELRVSVEAELLACRSHARLGGAPETARWATVKLAWHFEAHGQWRAA